MGRVPGFCTIEGASADAKRPVSLRVDWPLRTRRTQFDALLLTNETVGIFQVAMALGKLILEECDSGVVVFSGQPHQGPHHSGGRPCDGDGRQVVEFVRREAGAHSAGPCKPATSAGTEQYLAHLGHPAGGETPDTSEHLPSHQFIVFLFSNPCITKSVEESKRLPHLQ
jgi:hypothetical protein